jgi:regulator of protease activity HflC (stomatin/prohibitin superfamily)
MNIKMNPNRIGIIGGGVIALIVVLLFSQSIVETVDGGEIHVKQATLTGTLTTRAEEGLYLQMFGKITEYYRTSETYLSNDALDGGKGAETNATTVRFGDGGTAEIGSVTQWRMPLGDVPIIKIHRNYRGFASLSAQVRQWIIEVSKQTASTFKADETYSTRRGEFSQLITDQIANGLYATIIEKVLTPTNEEDEEGNVIMASSTRVVIKTDADGFPIIIKPGIFKEYGLELVNHTLKDIDYDETIDSLISQKKKAEQEKAVAITNAEKAVQDALTAEAQGEADIAKARATEEVAKITAVTQAEKAKAVAKLKAEQAKEVAEMNAQRDLNVAKLATAEARESATQRLVKEKAEADANALKVRAGLTPQQKAEWNFKIADVVSRNMSNIDLPDMMIFGGGEGSPMNPFDAIGLESFMNISETVKNQ